MQSLGFAPAQCRAPGLLLPLWTPDGSNGHYVYRPDNPRVYDDKRRGRLADGTYHQRVIKYELPKGAAVRLDCPPTCRPLLSDPAVPLFITEGQKKADALASRGACAVALLGVWNFKGRNDFGGTTLLADFDYIALDNRPVYLVFDSDVMSKTGVRAALERLTEHLQRKRAAVRTIYLPRVAQTVVSAAAGGTQTGTSALQAGGTQTGTSALQAGGTQTRRSAPQGKTGVDDWLVATGEGLDELMALAEGPRPEPKAAAPLTALLDLAPNRMARPLTLADGHAFAATWAWVQTTITESVNRRGEVVRHNPPKITIEERLLVLRDDGVVFGEGGDRPMEDTGLLVALPEILSNELRLSPAGLRAYREGYRPDPADVFRRICACVDRFIDFDRSLAGQATMAEMVAVYIMATWFLDAFTVAGFLWPNGERGCGKTQLLVIITQLAYLGQLVLAGGSFAALRDMADYGATLAFDDAENVGDLKRFDPDKRALLLAGNRRGNTVQLKEKDETGWRTRHVNTFSFRLFSAIQLPDSVLASRTIVVPLIRTPDRYRANADPLDYSLWPHDRRRLVDDLWLLGLAHLPRLGAYAVQVNNDGPLAGRNLEPWRALLAVAGWLTEQGVDGLRERMDKLAVSYQAERPNVEVSDLTVLIIQAMALLVSKLVKDRVEVREGMGISEVKRVKYFLLTEAITHAAHSLLATQELDLNPDNVTSRRIGRLLRKMRLTNTRQPGTGKMGWLVSLDDVMRWAVSYGMEPATMPGLNLLPQPFNFTNQSTFTNPVPPIRDLLQGEI